MNKLTKASLIALTSGAMVFMAGCDVDKTQEGQLPDVDVSGGQLPKYDVTAPEVNVTQERREITVPDVDVNTQQREITVPNIEVTPADQR